MQATIQSITGKKLVGIRSRMSLANDSTRELWRSLMPRRTEIPHRATGGYISMRVYLERSCSIEEMFAPTTVYEKWAAVEVFAHDEIPEGMQPYSLLGGLYAVFVHEGPASTFPATMRYIFGTWLPNSDYYQLDDREHFEVLPEGWKATDPAAREEVWISIRQRRGA